MLKSIVTVNLKKFLVDDIIKGDQILLQTGGKIPVDGIILAGELR